MILMPDILQWMDTDLTIFDPEADRLVSDHFASKAGNSPFVGETLKGKVAYTICDGQVIFQG